MSVLYVSHGSAVWGIERRLIALAPELAHRGVRLTLAAPTDGPLAALWRSHGLPHVPLALPAHHGLRRKDSGARASPVQLAREAAVVLESARRLAAVARRHDVIFSGSLGAHMEAALAGHLARRPSILMLVDIVAPGVGRRVLRSASRLAWTTVVNSTATAATLGGRVDIRLIHPGIDLDTHQPGPADPAVRAALGAGDHEFLIGIVGRIDEEKGIHDLVHAVAQLRSEDQSVRLAVVGDVGTGPRSYAERLHEDATALLGDGIRFAGRRDDIPAVMRALDVLVNASMAEPFGMSVLEAQACGTAVVAADSGGLPDFVHHDETGLLVAPGNVAALHDALARLHDDAALRERLGTAARRAAETRFDVRDQFRRYEELFRAAARR